MKGIHHIVFNEIRGTFQKLEKDEDNSFWFETSDYFLWYLKILENDYLYLEDRKIQMRMILDELSKRGLKI